MEDRDRTKEELIIELENMRRVVNELKAREKAFKVVEEEFHKRLVEYEKISALGRLTANVAHEIRNPITVIGGLARRLSSGGFSESNKKELLKLIMLETERLENILKEALAYTNKTTYHRQEHNVNEVLDELLLFFENICDKHSITIGRSLGEVPLLFIDRKQFKEALRNVISNAIDSMPDGGALTVATDKITLNGKRYVVIKVSDTGIGIPEENTLMIFEPFFTTKVTKKETGLGLPITRKIVEGHGGHIEVDSRVGKGSVFSLYFPYRESEKNRGGN